MLSTAVGASDPMSVAEEYVADLHNFYAIT